MHFTLATFDNPYTRERFIHQNIELLKSVFMFYNSINCHWLYWSRSHFIQSVGRNSNIIFSNIFDFLMRQLSKKKPCCPVHPDLWPAHIPRIKQLSIDYYNYLDLLWRMKHIPKHLFIHYFEIYTCTWNALKLIKLTQL